MRTNETEVVVVPAVSAVPIPVNKNFTGSSAEALQTGNAAALPGSVRRNVTAQPGPMDTTSTSSTLPQTESQSSLATMLHMRNQRKQKLFETQRQLQCSYLRYYYYKHGQES